jgi:hypothetical protein
MSGEQSILQFVAKSGAKGASGADINNHWKSEGRSGGAYTPIGKLVSAKKLKRRKVKGERGSRYATA